MDTIVVLDSSIINKDPVLIETRYHLHDVPILYSFLFFKKYIQRNTF